MFQGSKIVVNSNIFLVAIDATPSVSVLARLANDQATPTSRCIFWRAKPTPSEPTATRTAGSIAKLASEIYDDLSDTTSLGYPVSAILAG